MNQSTKYSAAVAIIIILILGGAFLYKTRTAQAPTTDGTGTTTTSGTVQVSLDGVPEGATVTVTDKLNKDLYDKTQRPSLIRDLPHGALPSEAYAILSKNRQTVVDAINANPAAMNNWLSLGLIHKQVNDFEGARIYWTYVATVNPENETAHWNLGSLYELYLKDNAKAEAEFKKVIAMDPQNIPAYIELSNMYVTAKDNTKAIAILTDGLSKNKGSRDLLIARAHVYRAMGRTTEARADYNSAITLAATEKNQELIDTLIAERDALK